MELQSQGKTVPPPFDPLTLAVMPENNTELGPLIEAMTVNVELFGWRLKPRVPVDEHTDPETLRTLEQEQLIAENFFENGFPDENSFEEFREKLRGDLESGGNYFVEFVLMPSTGRLDSLKHLPAWTVRLGKKDEQLTEYVDPVVVKSFEEVPEVLVGEEGSEELELVRKQRRQVTYELRPHVRFKRFRRYVQVVGRKSIWFKELGDPRLIDASNGEPVKRDTLLSNKPREGKEIPRFTLDRDGNVVVEVGKIGFPVAEAANPVHHVKLNTPRSSYGLPRYVGHLFSIFGSRASEEINYTTFKNNNMPSAVVTVQNGMLTKASIQRMEEFVEASIMSDDNFSSWLLLEGEPSTEGMGDPGSFKIEVKPLTREQHTDALFVEYQKSNDERVRRAFRMPPLFIGKSDDFTSKAIDGSRRVADEQVFAPERARQDKFFTKHVLLRLGIVQSTFKSNSPSVVENADLIRMLANGEKTGGITPRIARKLLGRVLNEELPDVDPDQIPPDAPLTWSIAQLMKSNSAQEATGGGEPTSQGRAGLQVEGPGRDRALEPAAEDLGKSDLERLAGSLRALFDERGFLGTAFDHLADDGEEGDE